MKKILVIGVLLLAGCNAQIKDEKKDLKYNLTQNGCATGDVIYANESDYCTALKDDKRNNFCARSMRFDMFKQSCPNELWN
jgi:hypothetical protein